MASGEKGIISEKMVNSASRMFSKLSAEAQKLQKLQGWSTQKSTTTSAQSVDYTKNEKALQSYLAQMHRMSQVLVGSSDKYTGTKALDASYKKTMSMYNSMATQMSKMLSGEKGPVTNNLIATAETMLKKYQTQLLETEAIQRRVFSGGGLTGATSGAASKTGQTATATTQKYLSQMQRVYN